MDDIGDWIALHNPAAAYSVVARLAARAKAIGERPFSFPLADVARLQNIRKRSVRPYLIFFRVALDEVEVLRIIHTRRDYSSMFQDL